MCWWNHICDITHIIKDQKWLFIRKQRIVCFLSTRISKWQIHLYLILKNHFFKYTILTKCVLRRRCKGQMDRHQYDTSFCKTMSWLCHMAVHWSSRTWRASEPSEKLNSPNTARTHSSYPSLSFPLATIYLGKSHEVENKREK